MANDTWIRMLQVNLIGPLNVCRCTAPALTEAKGTIVNISSMSGYAFDPPTAYAVSKAALNALTTCLAMELGAVGIAVVGVAPGLVGTEVVVGGMSDESLHYYLDTQAIPEIIEPHEMAAFVDSLLGESARLMTGHTVLADRGYVRGR
jgi:NAD(P)-dependent dehydrogenase (short-subunit alcohol dehydrogenase family)